MAAAPDLGGAVYVGSSATVTVSNVNLQINSARSGNGGRVFRVASPEPVAAAAAVSATENGGSSSTGGGGQAAAETEKSPVASAAAAVAPHQRCREPADLVAAAAPRRWPWWAGGFGGGNGGSDGCRGAGRKRRRSRRRYLRPAGWHSDPGRPLNVAETPSRAAPAVEVMPNPAGLRIGHFPSGQRVARRRPELGADQNKATPLSTRPVRAAPAPTPGAVSRQDW